MANDLNKMIFILEAQNEKLIKKLDESTRAVDKFKKQTAESSAAVTSSMQNMLAGFLSVGAIVGFTKRVIEATAEQEKLDRQFQRVAGSQQQANATLKQFNDLAKQTPASVDQLTAAFVGLKQKGLDASSGALLSYSNLAAAFGVSLEQTSQAVESAAQGRTMALKQFGIVAKAEGDSLAVTFEGVTTRIKNDGADIQRYLQDIGRTRYAGEAQKEADTMAGVMNKLSENIGDLFEQNGENVGRFKDSLKDLNATISDPKFKESFDILAGIAIDATGKMLNFVSTTVGLFQYLGEGMAAAIGGPAIDDLVRINDELDRAQHRLGVLTTAQEANSEKSGFFVELDRKNRAEQIAQLEAQIAKYKQMIEYSEAGARAQQAAGASGGVTYTPDGEIMGTGAGGGEGEESIAVQKAAKEAEKLAEIGQQKLERVMEELATEQELINEAYAAREEIILANTEEGSELQFELLVKNNERREAEIARHQDKITKLETKAMTDRQKFEAMTMTQRTQQVIGSLLQMTEGIAQHSKTAFKINKVAGVANAVVNTALAISKALSAYPPPLSFAMAAAAGAAGFAQVAAIKGTEYGGGGGGTTPSAAGGVPTVNSQPIGGSAADVTQVGKQAQVINISFDSRITDTGAIRRFIENEFNEALGDGVKINAVLR